MMDIEKCEKTIGVNFKDKKLLQQAFVHRSYNNENADFEIDHNERLEFLGDAVLELVVTEYLYNTYPDKSEGELTSLRAALVNSDMLSEIARDIGMNDYLYLSKGESKALGKARQYILANAFEALIGALYMDSGYSATESFIARVLLPKLSEVLEKKLWRDPKSWLQEEAQDKVEITPTYKVLSESGPDHAKRFTVGVFFGGELVASGSGFSKHSAEIEAALSALQARGWN